MKIITPQDFKRNDSLKEELQLQCWDPDGGLVFMAKYLLGFDRLIDKVHRPGAAFFQSAIETPDGVVAVRDSRASGKTTLYVKSGILYVWSHLPVPGTPVQGVNTRIAIVAPKKEIASWQFVKHIDDLYQQSKAYQELFDWVRPRPDFWSMQKGLMLYRTTASGDPSLTPVGMESISTSYHFDMMIVDDPIHEQNWMSETEVRRCVEWMYLSHNLTRSERGVRIFVGNFWRIGDVQDQLRPTNEYFSKVKVWERGMTGCAACVNGRGDYDSHQHEPPLFPLTLAYPDGTEPGMEVVEEARKSMPTYIYMAQCENNPVDAGALALKKEWLKKWTWHYYPDGEGAICVSSNPHAAKMAKEAGENKEFILGPTPSREIIPLWNTEMYILVDPAPSIEESVSRSQFAFAVVAREKRSPRTFLMQEYATNERSPLNMHAILDAWVQWYPYVKKIGYESVGYQSTIGDTLLELARNRGISTLRRDDLIPVPRLRSEPSQEDRIKYALIPLFEQGHFFCRPDQRIFMLQYDTMGKKGAKHDLLDALSNGPRVWQPVRLNSANAIEIAARARQRAKGAGPTGYG